MGPPYGYQETLAPAPDSRGKRPARMESVEIRENGHGEGGVTEAVRRVATIGQRRNRSPV